MGYWFTGYDQGAKVSGGKLPEMLKGYLFPEFTREYRNWDLNPWRNKHNLWYENLEDGLWFVTPEKKVDLDFFRQGMGFIVSDRYVEAVRDLWTEPHKLCRLNVVNPKKENNSVRPMYYYMSEKTKADVVDFSRIVEDGVSHRELLGPVETGLDENGNRYIVRSLDLPLKDGLGHFFICSSWELRDTVICSDEYRERCLEANLRGPRFDKVDDCMIIDFAIEPDAVRGCWRGRKGASRAIRKTERQRWESFDVQWPGDPKRKRSLNDFMKP